MMQAPASPPRQYMIAVVLALLTFLLGGAAQAAQGPHDPLVLQLKWLPQAQFAGYYVALDKGFYRREGLKVVIRPGGPTIDPAKALASGKADVAVGWLSTALAERERGIPLVNIAQIFQRPGYELTCRRDSRVRSPAGFKGKTLGTWSGGSEYPFLAWMAKLSLRALGPHSDIRLIRQGAGIEPLLDGKAACLSTMSYNEYWQVIDAGLRRSDLVVLPASAWGAGTLEDGLYVSQGRLGDRGMRDRFGRFLRASIAGWRYALAHRREAVAIVLRHGGGRLHRKFQARMLDGIARLIPARRRLGYLDPAAYRRTVAVLLAGKVEPVIRHKPHGAWTHRIWDIARRRLRP